MDVTLLHKTGKKNSAFGTQMLRSDIDNVLHPEWEKEN